MSVFRSAPHETDYCLSSAVPTCFWYYVAWPLVFGPPPPSPVPRPLLVKMRGANVNVAGLIECTPMGTQYPKPFFRVKAGKSPGSYLDMGTSYLDFSGGTRLEPLQQYGGGVGSEGATKGADEY